MPMLQRDIGVKGVLVKLYGALHLSRCSRGRQWAIHSAAGKSPIVRLARLFTPTCHAEKEGAVPEVDRQGAMPPRTVSSRKNTRTSTSSASEGRTPSERGAGRRRSGGRISASGSELLR